MLGLSFRFVSAFLVFILIDASVQSYANRSASILVKRSTQQLQGFASTNQELDFDPTNQLSAEGLRWKREETKPNADKKKKTGKGKKKKSTGKNVKKNKKNSKGKKKNGTGKKKNGTGKKKNGNGKKNKGKGKKNKGIGKNKAKKNKKGAKKNNKGKNGKGKKKKTKKTIRKGKKGKKDKKGKKGKATKQSSDEAVLACSADMMDVFKIYSTKQRSIKRQISRFGAKTKLLNNKKEKKDIFIDSFKNTMKGIGGDYNNPKCKAKDTMAPEVFETLISDLVNVSKILESCTDNINSTCEDPTTADIETQVQLCDTYVGSFEKDMAACSKLSGTAEICSCFKTMRTETYYEGLKNDCSKIGAYSTEAVTAYATCVETFGKCKKAEDAAVRRISECGISGLTGLNGGKLARMAGLYDDEEGDEDEDEEVDGAAAFIMMNSF